MAEIYTIDNDFDYSLFQGSSCAFGVFDGVHIGHRYLLDSAIETARKDGGLAIALTFDIDPDEIFHPERLKKLLSNEHRIEMLSKSGVDAVAVLKFDREFAGLSPMAFLEKTFGGHAPAHLHVGLDFHFGAKAAGGVAELGEWGAHSGTHIDAHNLKSASGEPITATRIRLLLAKPSLDEAAELLGRPYSITGTVEAGRGEGADMGFRTANLTQPANRQVLAEGVYAAYAIVDGQRYKAAVSVGVAPTFAARATATCEVHILEFDSDIYDDQITVEFVKHLRPMIKFDSLDELIARVMADIDWVRTNL